jgi:uncharacterized protein GlcG (DUF336 family)
VLTLDMAKTIGDAIYEECGKRGHQVAVIVVDVQNQPKYWIRADGTPAMYAQVAVLKATTAMLYDEPSRPSAEAPLQPDLSPSARRFGIPVSVVPGTMLNYGGVLIKYGDATIGGVGIEGGAPGGGAMAECANAALAKIPASAYRKLPDSRVLTLDLARALAEVVKLKTRTALLYEQPTGPEAGANPNAVSAAFIPGTFRGRGGLPIKVGAATIGAIAVSGAPGSANDEACAKGALEKLADQMRSG